MKSLKHRQFTRAEKDAIWRAFAPYTESYRKEFLAVAMLTLAETYGFGKKRLRRFFDAFGNLYDDTKKYYQYDRDDAIWVCTRKLRTNYGVDLEEWEKEWEDAG